MKYVTTIANHDFIVEIIDEQHVIVDGVNYHVDFDAVSDQPVYSLLVDGESYEAYVYQREDGWEVLLHGAQYPAIVEDERERRLRAAARGTVAQRGEYHLKAPMPGLVVSIPVEPGQEIQEGDVLVILESMKMQNELKSPRSGKVTRILVSTGDRVDQRQTLVSVGQ
jgi:biotin carboxyl carrier protein